MAGPLSGLRVLDATTSAAGSIMTMVLADYGADVIKIESGEGDPVRRQEGFLAWGRGKRSALFDSSSRSRQKLLELISGADILVESHASSPLESFGLAAGELLYKHPRLVMCTLSGGEGPDEVDPALTNDLLVSARLGLTVDGPSQKAPGWCMATYSSAVLGVIGALAAIRARVGTGHGDWIRVSMTDGVLAPSSMNAWWSKEGIYPFGRPGRGERGAIMKNRRLILGMFECGDGLFLQFHTGSPGGFTRALDALGIADLVSPSKTRMETGETITDEEQVALLDAVVRILKTQPRDHWVDVFAAADICCQPVYRPEEVFDDPQVRHNDLIVRVDDPVVGVVEQIGPAVSFSDTPVLPPGPAPRAGEHTPGIAWRSGQRVELGGDGVRPAWIHPLEGLRVLDLGMYFAGPFASRLLSDLGAHVIKLEPPVGDSMRPMPTVFEAAQRGKQGIVLDLKAPEAADVVRRLVEWADVVHHNFRPGIAEKLGVDYQSLRKMKPDLVYCFSPGFGRTGPKSSAQSFAPVTGGLSGLYYRAGGQGNPPAPAGNEDYFNAVLAASAILMALIHRSTSGHGQYIESPQINSALFLSTDVTRTADGRLHGETYLTPDRSGWNVGNAVYQTRDGWVGVACESEQDLLSLCEAAATTGSELSSCVRDYFARLSTEQCVDSLQSAGIPHVIPRRESVLTEVFEDGTSWWSDSGHVVTQEHAEYGQIKELSRFIHFSSWQLPDRGPAPRLGEHTEQVLADLGFP